MDTPQFALDKFIDGRARGLAAVGEWFRGTPDEMIKLSRQGFGGLGMETQFTSKQYRLSCGLLWGSYPEKVTSGETYD